MHVSWVDCWVESVNYRVFGSSVLLDQSSLTLNPIQWNGERGRLDVSHSPRAPQSQAGKVPRGSREKDTGCNAPVDSSTRVTPSLTVRNRVHER